MTELITCRLLNWCWVYSACLTPGLAAWPWRWPAPGSGTWTPRLASNLFVLSLLTLQLSPWPKYLTPSIVSFVATAENLLSLLGPWFPLQSAAKQGCPKNHRAIKTCESSRERLQMRGAVKLRERLQCSSETVSANPLWSLLIVPFNRTWRISRRSGLRQLIHWKLV